MAKIIPREPSPFIYVPGKQKNGPSLCSWNKSPVAILDESYCPIISGQLKYLLHIKEYLAPAPGTPGHEPAEAYSHE